MAKDVPVETDVILICFLRSFLIENIWFHLSQLLFQLSRSLQPEMVVLLESGNDKSDFHENKYLLFPVQDL